MSSILLLLTGQLLWFTGLASLLALPVAYWGIQRWLQDFAFRISIGPWLWVFGTGGYVKKLNIACIRF